MYICVDHNNYEDGVDSKAEYNTGSTSSYDGSSVQSENDCVDILIGATCIGSPSSSSQGSLETRGDETSMLDSILHFFSCFKPKGSGTLPSKKERCASIKSAKQESRKTKFESQWDGLELLKGRDSFEKEGEDASAKTPDRKDEEANTRKDENSKSRLAPEDNPAEERESPQEERTDLIQALLSPISERDETEERESPQEERTDSILMPLSRISVRDETEEYLLSQDGAVDIEEAHTFDEIEAELNRAQKQVREWLEQGGQESDSQSEEEALGKEESEATLFPTEKLAKPISSVKQRLEVDREKQEVPEDEDETAYIAPKKDLEEAKEQLKKHDNTLKGREERLQRTKEREWEWRTEESVDAEKEETQIATEKFDAAMKQTKEQINVRNEVETIDKYDGEDTSKSGKKARRHRLFDIRGKRHRDTYH